MLRLTLSVFLVLLLARDAAASDRASSADPHRWSTGETAVLKSLWIGSLPPLPKDPSNRYADDPRASALGKRIFFDPRFSANGTVSCATCHRPEMGFTDSLPLAHGIGTTTRRTMPLAGVAYSAWFFWDGRKDSLWSQALGPIENPVEHGISRTLCAFLIGEHYRREYEEIFGRLPRLDRAVCPPVARPADDDPEARKSWEAIPQNSRDAINRIYANVGKAIAAYVRQILPGPSGFDRYAEAILKGDGDRAAGLLSPDETAGLRLFVGRAKCINCHNGPMLSNSDFHRAGVPARPGLPVDRGRAEGIRLVLIDEFNCLGQHSDASPRDCGELRFMDTAAAKYEGAFKTPTLRSVSERAPYMHAGQFRNLSEVLLHYRQVKSRSADVDPSLEHGGLSDRELLQLEAFLKTLSGPVIAP